MSTELLDDNSQSDAPVSTEQRHNSTFKAFGMCEASTRALSECAKPSSISRAHAESKTRLKK